MRKYHCREFVVWRSFFSKKSYVVERFNYHCIEVCRRKVSLYLVSILTFLESGKQSELLGKARLHKGSIRALGGYKGGNDQEIVPQLAVVV